MMDRDASIWLVKSSGRVIGPYSQNEIVEMIRTKDIVVIDEVCEPVRRWQILRDHPSFEEIIEELRRAAHSGDDAITQVASFTGSLTETMDAQADEITDDIEEFQAALKEIVIDRPSLPPIPMTGQGQARYQAASSISDERVKKAAEKSSRWMWVLTFLTLLAVSLTWGIKRFTGGSAKQGAARDQVAYGLSMFEEGDYNESLVALKRAYSRDTNRKEIWFPLGLLLVNLEGQTVEGQRLFRKVIDSGVEVSNGWTALGLAQLTDGDFKAADESLRRALSQDHLNVAAKINSGVVALLKKEYPQARKTFREALDLESPEASAYIQYVNTLVYTWRSENDKNALIEAERVLDEAIKRVYPYQQEMRTARLYLSLLGGKADQNFLEREFRRVLDMDPNQTEDFKQSLLVARQTADWTQIGQWCRQLKDAASESASVGAFFAFCLLKQGQVLAAKAAVEKAVTQAPRDPLIQATFATILATAGFVGESSVALGRAIELDRKKEYMLPALLQAKFCGEREDFECARTNWMTVLQFDPNLPAARLGMAEVYHSLNAQTETNRIMGELRIGVPNYKPYLRLARKMGGY